ncbi:Translational regulator CsrA1 [Pseudomonas fluorescens]|uniref:Translational regulator CsrA n=1 Tax=Pseudomonas fluorescens TaxID=294 RepID=A0A5E7JE48_PSEFL|nr:carbon storage regulator [Pseudomonas fluorescens]VVO85517.1 Translational regulator CsrA1 [Pseudomonas fluorescens]
MLVINLKHGETIRLNNDISINIKEVRDQRVRIGIDAPKSMEVHREEIYQCIQNKAPEQIK